MFDSTAATHKGRHDDGAQIAFDARDRLAGAYDNLRFGEVGR